MVGEPMGGCYRPYEIRPTSVPLVTSRPVAAYPSTVARLVTSTSTWLVRETAVSLPEPGSVRTTTPGPRTTPTPLGAGRGQRTAPLARSTALTASLSAV